MSLQSRFLEFHLILSFSYAYAASIEVAIPNLGQKYQGGYVACKDASFPPFVVAVRDNAGAAVWGYYGQKTGATSLNNGLRNTIKIVNLLGSKGSTAAQICANYQVDSLGRTPCEAGATCYKNWFLPAKNQLNCVFKNKIKIKGIERQYYWSSTEDSEGPSVYAWDQDLWAQSSLNYAVIKNTYLAVKCIREITA